MGTVIMPKMGDAMEEGTLLKWLKAAGDEVSEGDPIAEIETDKVTLEIEAQEDGFLTNLLVEEGTTAPIGTAIATIGTQDEVGKAPVAAEPVAEAAPAPESAPAPAPEPVAATAPAAAPAPAPVAAEPAAQVIERAPGERLRASPLVKRVAAEPAPAPAPEPVAAQAASADQPAAAPEPVAAAASPAPAQVVERAPGERLRASPLVKRLADEHGIDLGQVAGTGPGGRIVNRDIADFVSGARPIPVGAAVAAAPVAANGQVEQAAAPAAAGAPKGTKIDLSRIRRTTGKRMAESKAGIPHYYVTSSVNMTAALDFRKTINASLEATGGKVSVNDLIVKAAALALRDHPEVNTSFEGGELYQHDSIDINIAIALDGGLIAPFVPSADSKSLGAISHLTKDLGKRAREGGLTPEEYQGGTFTISNLGMFDVDEFIAVINPPQAAILAVGSVSEVPVVKDGAIAIGHVMKLTLSADHRALDGATVATFLQSVKGYLENPLLLAIG